MNHYESNRTASIGGDLIEKRLTIRRTSEGKLVVSTSTVPRYNPGMEIENSSLSKLIEEGITYTIESKAAPGLLLG